MADPLPPLHALRAFITVAERGGVRRAAEALNLSEAAVSHQIKNLERHLGQRLFEKDGRGLRLTEIGHRYLGMVVGPVAELRQASEAVSSRRVARQATLTLAPTLASLWLIPALGDFERAFPDVSLHLVTTTQILDLERHDIDIAIRYLPRAAVPDHAVVVFSETAFPVCSPERYKETDDPAQPTEFLSRSRLLVNDTHPDEWNWWSTAGGEAVRLSRERQRFDASHMTLEAAAQGYGVALGRRPLVDSYLASGRLVAPFGTAFETGFQYVILTQIEGIRPVTKRVIDWIANRFRLHDEAIA